MNADERYTAMVKAELDAMKPGQEVVYVGPATITLVKLPDGNWKKVSCDCKLTTVSSLYLAWRPLAGRNSLEVKEEEAADGFPTE